MVMVLCSYAAKAQHASRQTEVTVFFRTNSSTVERAYFGNAEALDKLDKTIDVFRMNIDSITIVAYASPDGNVAYNTALSARRASSMHKYLNTKYPDVNFKHVKEIVGGPDFDGLTRKIEADSKVPYRREVLELVRNWGSNPDLTFRKLKLLRNGVPYNYIRYHYLPWLRTATTVIFHYNASISLYKEQQEQLGIKENAGFEDFVMPKSDVNWGQGSSTELMPSPVPGQSSTSGTWSSSSTAGAGTVSVPAANATSGQANAAPAGAAAEAGSADSQNVVAPLPGAAAGQSGDAAAQSVIAPIPTDGSSSAAGAGAAAGVAGAGAAGAGAGTNARNSEGAGAGATAAAAAGAGAAAAATTGQPADSTATQAEEHVPGSTGIIFRFGLNSSEIDPDDPQNAENLRALRQAIAEGRIVPGDEIEVNGFASPDGNSASNKKLTERRAENAVEFIENELPEGVKINFVSRGEDWEGLEKNVEKNYHRSDREQVLAILRSDKSDKEKKAAINSLDPESRKVIVGEMSEDLRSVRFNITKGVPEMPVLEEVQVKEDSLAVEQKNLAVANEAPQVDTMIKAPEVQLSDDVQVQDEEIAVDSTKLVVANDTPAVESLEPVYEIYERPLFAATTNALYDIVATPNFGYEIPIGHRFSFFSDYTFPWWITRDNSRAWQMLKWDIGGRWYFSRHDKEDRFDILNGHYLGLDLSAGYYDLEPHHKGYQGEFQMFALQYGYGWVLGKHWRLDANVGAGLFASHYRYYKGDSRDKHLIYQHHGKIYWFGPVHAGISFKYLFTVKQRREVK